MKSLAHEGNKLALWAGFVPYFLSTLTYAGLTIGITGLFTDSWKRKNGLEEWQI